MDLFLYTAMDTRKKLEETARSAAGVLAKAPQRLTETLDALDALPADSRAGWAVLRDRSRRAAEMLAEGGRGVQASDRHYAAHEMGELNPSRARDAFAVLQRVFDALAAAPTLTDARALPLTEWRREFDVAYESREVQLWLTRVLGSEWAAATGRL